MGLGLEAVSSDRRVPRPPARMTTFTTRPLPEMTNRGRWRQCIRHRQRRLSLDHVSVTRGVEAAPKTSEAIVAAGKAGLRRGEPTAGGPSP
jgi:hypothetical protein